MLYSIKTDFYNGLLTLYIQLNTINKFKTCETELGGYHDVFSSIQFTIVLVAC